MREEGVPGGSDGGQGTLGGREGLAGKPQLPARLYCPGDREPGRPLAGRALGKRAAQAMAVRLCAESQVLFNRPPLWYLEAERFQTSARGQLEP